MRMSRDVVFDESRPFYPCPTTDGSPASLVDPLSFLLFPNAPAASLPIPRSTLPSIVSSSESPRVVPDYMMKPLVTQFYNHHGARLSDAPASLDELSFDVSSSSFFENVTSSLPVEPSSRSSLLDVVTAFVGHMIVTLLRLSQPLLFLSQLLITMVFFFQNGNT
jgi:hypothetical protein